jgi:hypothetical protein
MERVLKATAVPPTDTMKTFAYPLVHSACGASLTCAPASTRIRVDR